VRGGRKSLGTTFEARMARVAKEQDLLSGYEVTVNGRQMSAEQALIEMRKNNLSLDLLEKARSSFLLGAEVDRRNAILQDSPDRGTRITNMGSVTGSREVANRAPRLAISKVPVDAVPVKVSSAPSIDPSVIEQGIAGQMTTGEAVIAGVGGTFHGAVLGAKQFFANISGNDVRAAQLAQEVVDHERLMDNLKVAKPEAVWGDFAAKAATAPLALVGGAAYVPVSLVGRLGIGAATGGASQLFVPVNTTQGGYWSQKGVQLGAGAAFGMGGTAVGEAAPYLVSAAKPLWTGFAGKASGAGRQIGTWWQSAVDYSRRPGGAANSGGKPQIVYRALTAADAEALQQGRGLVAKAPDGTWTAAEHVANSGPGAGGAAGNSPWISTTRELEIAKAYDSGHGVIAIDLNKVPSLQVEVWRIATRFNSVSEAGSFDRFIPYHRSIWAQEVTIGQRIPHSAVLGRIQ
jgi:hypothetical protein